MTHVIIYCYVHKIFYYINYFAFVFIESAYQADEGMPIVNFSCLV